jgi:hypothetical protein
MRNCIKKKKEKRKKKKEKRKKKKKNKIFTQTTNLMNPKLGSI